MSLYDELRQKHRGFIYHSYDFSEQERQQLLTFLQKPVQKKVCK